MKKWLNKVKAWWLITGLAVLGACATQTLPPGGQVTESVITACSSYGTVLSALTPFKPKLSAGDVATVNKSVALTMPICSDPNSYNTSGALAAVVAETANLKTILAKAGGQ